MEQSFSYSLGPGVNEKNSKRLFFFCEYLKDFTTIIPLRGNIILISQQGGENA